MLSQNRNSLEKLFHPQYTSCNKLHLEHPVPSYEVIQKSITLSWVLLIFYTLFKNYIGNKLNKV